MKCIDENVHIVVSVPIKLEREIGGCIYTITGSYDGTKTLPAKVVRLMQQDAKTDPQEGD